MGGEVSARDVPLEERLRQKKNGFAVHEGAADAATGGSGSRAHKDGAASGKKPRAEVAQRANKNRPMEITSKRAVGRLRQVVEVKKKKRVDPRFESTSGRLNEDLFGKSYAFLDEYKVCAGNGCFGGSSRTCTNAMVV